MITVRRPGQAGGSGRRGCGRGRGSAAAISDNDNSESTLYSGETNLHAGSSPICAFWPAARFAAAGGGCGGRTEMLFLLRN